jgi:type IV secretion system protein VirB8
MTDEERTRYYHEAGSWALSQRVEQAGSLRRTRILAGALALVAILEAFALVLLIPLKSVTMVPVLVDRQTGYVERLSPDGSQELHANDALVRSMLAQYVVARESFNITNVGTEYHKVALWSGGSARRDYLALMPASNPQSPLRLYPRSTLLETWIKSVSQTGPGAALVRFETRRRDQGAPASSVQEWVALIGYRFSNASLSAADRWANPLAFQVVSYHRDPEVTPAPEAGPAPSPQPGAAASAPALPSSARP